MISYRIILLASLMLGACGGGGGSSSSGGSALSSAGGNTASPCGSEGVVFAECLNENWGAFKVWEWNTQANQGQEYESGTNASNVQWQIVDSPTAGKGKVVEVRYGEKANYLSDFTVHGDAVDRTTFATGTLNFDLKVEDFGDAYNPNTGAMLFDVYVGCKWPCISHIAKVPVRMLNQWQTVTLKVADMVRDGLDLTKVNVGLMIRPSAEASQTGVTFQLDNIKWVKGTGKLTMPKEVFVEHFSTENSINDWVFVAYEGEITRVNKHLTEGGLGTFPEWRATYDHWALERSLTKAINIKNKKVSLQLKLFSEVNGYSSPLEFELVATDGGGNTAVGGHFSSLEMVDREWHQFELQLGNSFPSGFNAADVRKLALHVYATGLPFAHGFIYLDTIRITE